MEENYEKIIEVGGKKTKFEIYTIISTFLFWFCFEHLSVSLSFLEMNPIVNYEMKNHKFNQSKLDKSICLKYNYTINQSIGHSWVTSYKLECHNVYIGLLGTFTFLGVFLGALLFQQIANRIGRKKSIVLSGFVFGCTLTLYQFIESFHFLWILILIQQCFASLGNLSSYMLMNEIVCSDWRPTGGSIVQSSFTVSGIFFILVYWYLDSWKIPFLMNSIFVLINTIIFLIIGVESPRYYSSKNQTNLFIDSLHKISIFNGNNKIFEKLVVDKYYLRDSKVEHDIDFKKKKKGENDEKIIDNEENKEIESIIHTIKNFNNQNQYNQSYNKNPDQYTFLTLLKYNSTKNIFILLCFMWFSTSGMYYGLTLNIKNLPGNTYINGIVNFTFEGFSYMTAGMMIKSKTLGRKYSIFILYSISFSSYFISILFGHLQADLINLLALLARLCISGVYNILYTYSTEVYPTVVRPHGLGMNSLCGRIGGMIFPIFLEIFSDNIKYIFLVLNFFALIVAFHLPETLGTELKTNFDEEKNYHTFQTTFDEI